MNSFDDFRALYKTISHTELLSILENHADYLPIAIDAAKAELADRHLTENEISEAKQPIVSIQVKKEKQAEKIKAIESKLKSTGNSIIDTLNPIQEGLPTTEKTIRYIVLVFGLLILYYLVTEARNTREYLRDFDQIPLAIILLIFPIIISPVAIFFFWKRKTLGWVLLTILATFSIVTILFELYYIITWETPRYSFLVNEFSRPDPIAPILRLVFFGATLFVICKPTIREIFSVTQQKKIATIRATAIITFLFVMAVMAGVMANP